MIRSMTGFGRGKSSSDHINIQVDLRSVNHRYLDLQFRLPRTFLALEPEIRDWVKTYFQRGHLETFVLYKRQAGGGGQVQVNEELARHYFKAIGQIAQVIDADHQPSLELIARQAGVIELSEDEESLEEIRPLLMEALAQAKDNLQAMREAEGRSLEDDLRKRVALLRDLVVRLQDELPVVHAQLEARWREKVADLAKNVELDEARLHQETVLLLARSDVHEEITRLNGHLDHLEKLLNSEQTVGKRLDFLAQELHREITTCGNKVQSLPITRLVVEIKTEIERIREQVQNVE